MADIRIVPANSILSFTSSLGFIERITQGVSGSLTLYGSGSTGRTELLAIDGNNGRLFTVADDLSDSLFSVNTIAGLPVFEVFATNSIIAGEFGQSDWVVSGNQVGIGTSTPGAKLHVQGNISASSITASFYGTASNARSSSYPWSGSNEIFRGNGRFGINMDPTGLFNVSLSGSSMVGYYDLSRCLLITPSEVSLNSWDVPVIIGDAQGSGNATIFKVDDVNRKFTFEVGKVGIGVTIPTNSLDVGGNISCSVITASLFYGTASFATSASYALSASYARSGSWTAKVSGSVTGSGALLYGNIKMVSSSAQIGYFGTVAAGTARVEVDVGSLTIRGEDVTNAGNSGTAAYHGGNILLLAGTGSGFGAEDRSGDGGFITLRGGVGYDNDGAQQRGGNIYFIGGQSQGGGAALTGYIEVTGSRFTSQCGLTGSLRGTASIAQDLTSNRVYTTITSGSDNWITCSFNRSEQYFDLTTGLNYTITCSNPPIANRLSDTRIFFNNTAAATSSLTFGAGWKNLSGGWPVSITSSKSFMVVLTAYGPTTVVGSFIAEV